MSVEFDKSIKAHFPVGSYVKGMGQILNDNEFQHDWSCDSGQKHSAWREELLFPSRMRASIHWRADETGRIVEIRGAYRQLFSL